MKQFVLIRNFRPFPFLCFAVILLCGLLTIPVIRHSEATAAAKSGEVLKGTIIAVDAGHGGSDPGAIGVTGTIEKEINLILAKKLEALLTKKGAIVVMTRTEDDTFSEVKKDDLDARAALVKKEKAELFLSIQCNATPNSSLRGAQTFYYPESKEGEALAKAIQNRFVRTLKNTDRKALTLSSAYIMGKLDIPAIMVEVGFLSNPEEEALLKNNSYQEKIVAAIYSGITDYEKEKHAKPSWLEFILPHRDKQ